MIITIYTNMKLQPHIYPEGVEEIEDIELTGEVLYEGGDHRYKGYHYLDQDTVTWNKDKYTQQQNKKIEIWIEANYSDLDDHFCQRYILKYL